MTNSQNKINKFVQAITAYAQEQRDKILLEAEAFKAERLQKAEQEVLADAYKLIQKETAEIRSESVREMYRRDTEARKALFSRRRQITDEVFKRAQNQLIEFTKKPEYTEYITKMLENMISMLPESIVYMIAQKDSAMLETLSSLCPEESSIKTVDDILIGGIRALNSESGQIIDNTLDSRLMSQHERFILTSGLNIE
ncbi:MAG: V-type ATP synthase subunit E [Oscillospiraceae bacterium]|nr:V-type ATP synthase subunit E [Oscillospiraceae bacterium]MDD3832849.1 V-type ATP synthase subunit E [Oscillospiraceae bacterium]MDD4546659.1 V-type ATP synthase subunit E [Oscillospiraceae bacterium]